MRRSSDSATARRRAPPQGRRGRRHRARFAHRDHVRLWCEIPEEVSGRPLHQRLELRKAPRRPPQAATAEVEEFAQRPATAGDRRGHEPEGRRDVPGVGGRGCGVGPLPCDLQAARVDVDGPARPPPGSRSGTCADRGLPRAPGRQRNRCGLATPGRQGPGERYAARVALEWQDPSRWKQKRP